MKSKINSFNKICNQDKLRNNFYSIMYFYHLLVFKLTKINIFNKNIIRV